MPTLEVVKPKPANALVRSVDDYLAAKKAAGLSRKTVEVYETVLGRVFLPFLADRGIEKPQEITQRVLDRLSSQLLEEGGARGQLSRHTVHSYMGTISHYVAWASKEGEIAAGIKPQRVKLPRRVLDVLSREEIRSLEDAAASERDKLIVRVLADTGLRLSELLGLTAADLIEQGRDRLLRVHGKGAKDRLVPVTPGLYQRLKRYAERGRPRDTSSDRIFLTAKHSRKTGQYEELEPRAVQDVMASLGERAGIRGKPTNPHALRHAFATHCLRRGMNTVVLQKILGHESLDMISLTYSHLVPADAASALMAVLRSDD
jgi:site-specific recombinase XerD